MLSRYLSKPEIDDVIAAGFSGDTGLRYSLEFLQSHKFDIARMTIDDIAEFVDAITYTHVRKNDTEFFRSMLTMPPEDQRVQISITGLGNIAFTALNMPDKETRERAIALFTRLQPTEQ
jgi:chloramphenicol O-acetyltransferase